jgi:O-acetyl-ADP-ribose deacetylase (regulator of RNase III)
MWDLRLTADELRGLPLGDAAPPPAHELPAPISLPSPPACGYNVVWGNIIDLAHALRGQRVGLVNAANAAGLGCFLPGHTCLDNQIYLRAGPQLRLEMAAKPATGSGERVPVGTCTPSRGHGLAVTAILHTTAPNCSGRRPTDDDWAALLRCYAACVDAGRALGLDIVLFPALGTGVFGFPKAEAARRVHECLASALRSIESKPSPRIVLVAFTRDEFKTTLAYAARGAGPGPGAGAGAEAGAGACGAAAGAARSA